MPRPSRSRYDDRGFEGDFDDEPEEEEYEPPPRRPAREDLRSFNQDDRGYEGKYDDPEPVAKPRRRVVDDPFFFDPDAEAYNHEDARRQFLRQQDFVKADDRGFEGDFDEEKDSPLLPRRTTKPTSRWTAAELNDTPEAESYFNDSPLGRLRQQRGPLEDKTSLGSTAGTDIPYYSPIARKVQDALAEGVKYSPTMNPLGVLGRLGAPGLKGPGRVSDAVSGGLIKGLIPVTAEEALLEATPVGLAGDIAGATRGARAGLRGARAARPLAELPQTAASVGRLSRNAIDDSAHFRALDLKAATPADEALGLVRVYHATDPASAANIRAKGFNKGGFFATDPEQARLHAIEKRGVAEPEVLEFDIPRESLYQSRANPMVYQADGKIPSWREVGMQKPTLIQRALSGLDSAGEALDNLTPGVQRGSGPRRLATGETGAVTNPYGFADEPLDPAVEATAFGDDAATGADAGMRELDNKPTTPVHLDEEQWRIADEELDFDDLDAEMSKARELMDMESPQAQQEGYVRLQAARKSYNRLIAGESPKAAPQGWLDRLQQSSEFGGGTPLDPGLRNPLRRDDAVPTGKAWDSAEAAPGKLPIINQKALDEIELQPAQVTNQSHIAPSIAPDDAKRVIVRHNMPENIAKNSPASRQSVQAGNINVGSLKKPDQWARETEAILTPDEIAKNAAWYKEVSSVIARAFQTEDPAKFVRAYFASQVNISVEGGMGNLLRAYDEVLGFPSGKVPGSDTNVAAGIMNALTGFASSRGAGVKISDFFDSQLGKLVRTVAGDDPRGGAPFVADIWTTRDAGYVDEVVAKHVQDKTGKTLEQLGLKKDFEYQLKDGKQIGGTANPSDNQYEVVSKWGNDLTDSLNQQGWLGRNDWTTPEIQAIGWAKMRKEFGAAEANMATAVTANTRTVRTALEAGPTSALASHADWGSLDDAGRLAASQSFGQKVVAHLQGVFPSARISNERLGGMAEGHLQFDIFGSPEMANDVGASYAHFMGVDAAVSKPMKSGKVAFTDVSTTGLSPAQRADLENALAKLPGYQFVAATKIGDEDALRVVGVGTPYGLKPDKVAAAEAKVNDAIQKVLTDAGIADTKVTAVHGGRLDIEMHKGAGNDSAEQALRARGRPETAGALAGSGASPEQWADEAVQDGRRARSVGGGSDEADSLGREGGAPGASGAEARLSPTGGKGWVTPEGRVEVLRQGATHESAVGDGSWAAREAALEKGWVRVGTDDNGGIFLEGNPTGASRLKAQELIRAHIEAHPNAGVLIEGPGGYKKQAYSGKDWLVQGMPVSAAEPRSAFGRLRDSLGSERGSVRVPGGEEPLSDLERQMQESLAGKKPPEPVNLTVNQMRQALVEEGLDSSGTPSAIIARYRGMNAGQTGTSAIRENVQNASRDAYAKALEATGDPERARMAARRAAAQETESQSKVAEVVKRLREERGSMTPEAALTAPLGLISRIGVEIVGSVGSLISLKSVISPPLMRQGKPRVLTAPVKAMKEFWQSIKAAASPEYADLVDNTIRTDDWVRLTSGEGTEAAAADRFAKGLGVAPEGAPVVSNAGMTWQDVGGTILEYGTGANSEKAAEELALMRRSWLGRKIASFWPVAISDVQASTMLNLMRTNWYREVASGMFESGIRDIEAYSDLRRVIEHVTQRGSWGQSTPLLFSTRALSGRVQAGLDPFFQIVKEEGAGITVHSTHAAARKESVKALVAMTTYNMTQMFILSSLGAGTIVFNDNGLPTLKDGNFHFDPWSGWNSIAKLVIGTGKEVSEAMNENGDDWGNLPQDLAQRITGRVVDFARKGLSPGVGVGVSAVTGEDFMGKPYNLKDEVFSGRMFFESMAPFIVESTVEQFKEQGMQGVGKYGIPSFLSESINVYEDTDSLKQRYAKTLGIDDSYDQMDYQERKQVDNAIKAAGEWPFEPSKTQAAAEKATDVIRDKLDGYERAHKLGQLDQQLGDYYREVGNELAGKSEVQSAFFEAEGIEAKSDFAKRFGPMRDKYYGPEVMKVDEFGQVDWDATRKNQAAFMSALSTEPGKKGAPTDRELFQSYIDYNDSQKTPLQQRRDKMYESKEAAGYYEQGPPGESLKDRQTRLSKLGNELDKANPEIDVEAWYFTAGQKEGMGTSTLQTGVAVDKALSLVRSEGLGNRYVKLEGLTRPINQDENSLRAWSETKKLVTGFEKLKADPELRDAYAQRSYDLPFKALSADQQGTVTGNIGKALRQSIPELDGALLWWGNGTVTTQVELNNWSVYAAKYGMKPHKAPVSP